MNRAIRRSITATTAIGLAVWAIAYAKQAAPPFGSSQMTAEQGSAQAQLSCICPPDAVYGPHASQAFPSVGRDRQDGREQLIGPSSSINTTPHAVQSPGVKAPRAPYPNDGRVLPWTSGSTGQR